MVRDSDRLKGLDFEAHNAQVAETWEAYRAGRPVRTPAVVGTNTRYFMLGSGANSNDTTFEQYTEDPDVMFETLLEFQRWSRFNLLQDAELGPPSEWVISVDFQNWYEAAWFGCKLQYFDDQVPDTLPEFADCPEKVMEQGLPDPFGSALARGLEYYEHFKDRASRESYEGVPIRVVTPGFGCGTDGPMTVACNLFGPDVFCLMLAAEPERATMLLQFITDATVNRMRTWREREKLPERTEGMWIADDSIALISTPMYREMVMPHHRRLYETFGTDKPGGIHLCGDATRHMRTIHEELNVGAFDTGFPVDFRWLRSELGPEVGIQGGPHVEIVRSGSRQQVIDESKRILETGVLEGGMFVLREGNNLAPGTPLKNCEALYEAAQKFGLQAGHG